MEPGAGGCRGVALHLMKTYCLVSRFFFSVRHSSPTVLQTRVLVPQSAQPAPHSHSPPLSRFVFRLSFVYSSAFQSFRSEGDHLSLSLSSSTLFSPLDPLSRMLNSEPLQRRLAVPRVHLPFPPSPW